MSLPPFSGNPLLDLQVLRSLSDPDLFSICQSNEYIAGLCRDDLFWEQRFIEKYGVDISEDMSPYDTYRQAYIKMAQPLIIPTYYRWIEPPGPEYRLPINAANNGYLSLLDSLIRQTPLISIHRLMDLISLTAPYRTFRWLSQYRRGGLDTANLAARLMGADRIDAVDTLLEAHRLNQVAYDYVSIAKVVNVDYIDWLVDRGLEFDELDDPNDPTSDITVADQLMDRAAGRGDLPLIIYFMKRGASPRRMSEALYEVLSAPRETAMEVAKFLVDQGADPSGAFIQYPIKEEGNPELTRYLIERGGRVSSRALEEAAEYGTAEMLRAYLTDPTLTEDQILEALDMTGDPRRNRLLQEGLRKVRGE